MTTPSRRNQIYHIYGSITEYHTELCEPTHPIGAPGLSSQTMGVVAFQVCREGSDASLYPEESALSARNRRSYVLDSREGKLHVLSIADTLYTVIGLHFKSLLFMSLSFCFCCNAIVSRLQLMCLCNVLIGLTFLVGRIIGV